MHEILPKSSSGSTLLHQIKVLADEFHICTTRRGRGQERNGGRGVNRRPSVQKNQSPRPPSRLRRIELRGGLVGCREGRLAMARNDRYELLKDPA